MSKKHPHKTENEALQSGADRPAFGEDERDFGAGGQRALDPDEWENPPRDPYRDPKIFIANPELGEESAAPEPDSRDEQGEQ